MVLLALIGAGATQAEVTATHDTIITFNSSIFPRVLPRTGSAPVGIRIEAHLKARKKSHDPAALTSVQLGIHKAANLSLKGLPVCEAELIDPASTAMALKACPGAQIGHGHIRAKSTFPGTHSSYYFNGHVTIFNGRLENGRPAILLHVFNPTPPTSFVFPLTISHPAGLYHTLLSANVRIGRWSHITDFKLVLDRTYDYRGKRRSYISAGCPAPKGLSVGLSSFVLATLGFEDGTESKISVLGSCRVRH